jgi:hypothetical protein
VSALVTVISEEVPNSAPTRDSHERSTCSWHVASAVCLSLSAVGSGPHAVRPG